VPKAPKLKVEVCSNNSVCRLYGKKILYAINKNDTIIYHYSIQFLFFQVFLYNMHYLIMLFLGIIVRFRLMRASKNKKTARFILPMSQNRFHSFYLFIDEEVTDFYRNSSLI